VEASAADIGLSGATTAEATALFHGRSRDPTLIHQPLRAPFTQEIAGSSPAGGISGKVGDSPNQPAISDSHIRSETPGNGSGQRRRMGRARQRRQLVSVQRVPGPALPASSNEDQLATHRNDEWFAHQACADLRDCIGATERCPASPGCPPTPGIRFKSASPALTARVAADTLALPRGWAPPVGTRSAWCGRELNWCQQPVRRNETRNRQPSWLTVCWCVVPQP
jgi:hypothetical protein